jgi:hypothetical protein
MPAMTKDEQMPRGLTPQDFTSNRRCEPRHTLTRVVDVLPCNAPVDWKFVPAEIIDCSMHGLGLLSTLPIRPGQQFIVKLIIAAKVKLLLYTVQNCSSSDKSHYRLGARFSGFATGQERGDLQDIFDALIASITT